MPKPNRRFILSWLTGVGATLLARPAAALQTPSAAEGPFYPTPKMRFADADNDLVKIAGLVEEAGGEIMTLSGRITDSTGAPRVAHRIEIWQCDTNGKYLHTGDRNPVPRDTAFQGFGHDVTDAEGRYWFRTIKPVTYPGRTPHIHAKVIDPDGVELLTTQFYLADHPGNATDGLFRSMSREAAARVSMPLNDNAEATVDVVI